MASRGHGSRRSADAAHPDPPGVRAHSEVLPDRSVAVDQLVAVGVLVQQPEGRHAADRGDLQVAACVPLEDVDPAQRQRLGPGALDRQLELVHGPGDPLEVGGVDSQSDDGVLPELDPG